MHYVMVIWPKQAANGIWSLQEKCIFGPLFCHAGLMALYLTTDLKLIVCLCWPALFLTLHCPIKTQKLSLFRKLGGPHRGRMRILKNGNKVLITNYSF